MKQIVGEFILPNEDESNEPRQTELFIDLYFKSAS